MRKSPANQALVRILFIAATRFHCDGNDANLRTLGETSRASISWPAAIGTRIRAPRNSSNRRDG
jgi:hypothetical protein